MIEANKVFSPNFHKCKKQGWIHSVIAKPQNFVRGLKNRNRVPLSSENMLYIFVFLCNTTVPGNTYISETKLQNEWFRIVLNRFVVLMFCRSRVWQYRSFLIARHNNKRNNNEIFKRVVFDRIPNVTNKYELNHKFDRFRTILRLP